MGKNIRLSKKYGVNPTIPICFWCGKEKNEIVLLGNLPGDKEAPINMWINGDYEPCDECRSKWEQGIVLIEAMEHPSFTNQLPMYRSYPTGRIVIVNETFIRNSFSESAIERTEILKRKCGFIPVEVMEEITRLKK